MSTKKQKIKCPVCGSENHEKYWAMSGYKLARCLDCETVWDYFPSENLLSQYDTGYFSNDNPKGGYTNYYEGMNINKKTFSERLKKIEKNFGKGKLLDVGCALGDCLMVAKKRGWRAPKGLEVSNYAYKIAKSRRLDVKKGTLGPRTYPKNSFDTVMYQDVIEHITDPVNELKKVYNILKPGGVVFLVTPDVGGIWHKLLGPMWYHYKPVEHVVYFSQGSLRKALEESGFKNIKTAKTFHVLSTEYILNRLKYYSPNLFEMILKLVLKTPLKNLSFRAYTGEIEAWGQKEK